MWLRNLPHLNFSQTTLGISLCSKIFLNETSEYPELCRTKYIRRLNCRFNDSTISMYYWTKLTYHATIAFADGYRTHWVYNRQSMSLFHLSRNKKWLRSPEFVSSALAAHGKSKLAWSYWQIIWYSLPLCLFKMFILRGWFDKYASLEMLLNRCIQLT